MVKKRKKRWGDRADGRRLRSIDPFNALMPFIFKTRNTSSNSFADSIEISEVEKYLREKRRKGYPGMGYMHLFIASYIRVASQYPGVNRFISGQRVFARYKIEFVMIVKKGLRVDAPETTIKVAFSPSDTIFDVYEKVNFEVKKVREEIESNATVVIAKAFMKLPRIIIKFLIRMLEITDYFGIMPKFILNASPFHSSIFFTDLGSIGLPPVFHHLYDFGNMPVFIALGTKKRVYELNSKGEVIPRKYIDYKMVMDERVVDGFYFSQAIKLFKSLIKKPYILDKPPETVVEDID